MALVLAWSLLLAMPVVEAGWSRGAPVPPGSGVISTAVASPRARLEALAAAERQSPEAAPMSAPAPEGLLESTGPLPDVSRAEARLSLDEVMERYGALSIDPAVEAPAEASAGDRFLAARLYVQGQSKLLDGDATGASADLEQATVLDPGAASLWLALGEARLRSGADAAGIEAMSRAVGLGLEDPRALLLLCTWGATRGQFEGAIHHGVRAVRALGRGQDPALRHMAWASLGDALHGAGLVRASASAYVQGFDLPEQFPGGTRYAGEMSSMYRGAWDALFRGACAAMAVGDWGLAGEALDHAARFGSPDGGRLLTPRVWCAMRLGRPAEAALAIVEAIDARSAATDPRARRMIGYVRRHSQVGPALAAALTEIDTRSRGTSATVEGAMARAIAAGLPDGLGRGPLVELLGRHPGDLGAMRDLIASFGEGEREGAIAAAVMLASRHPAHAQTVGDAMVLEGLRRPSDLDLLRRRLDRPGAGLLGARLLIEAARFDEARRVLEESEEASVGSAPAEGTDPEGDLRAARVLCRASLESMSGRGDEARRLVESWGTPATVSQRLCLVRALVAVGDAERARDASGGVAGISAEPGGAGGEGDALRALLLQAAQMARAAGDGEEAEGLARRLLEEDASAEGGYAVLIAVHSPGGGRADQGRLQEAVQGLRERLPASTLLRFLSGREFMQFGRAGEADARLRGLALDVPEDDNVLRALQEVWAQRAAREGSFVYDEAEALLERLMAGHPWLLGPYVARAQLAIARDRAEEAPAAVGAWLERGLISTADDRNRVRAVVEALMRRATSGPDARSRTAVLELWDRMAAAGAALDPPMHQARLVLLTQAAPIDDAAVLSAAALASEQASALGAAAYLAPVGRVVQAGRADLGLVLLREGAARRGGWSAEDTVRWAGLIAQHGSAEDLRDLLRLTPDRATLESMLAELPGAAGEEGGSDLSRLRGDIAYALSAATRILDRPFEVSEAFLRMALEEFGDHESAANDLGYLWADRGVNLGEAERLLLMAARLQPGEANVLDSLGWLRYKQGRLADVIGADGSVVEEGAVSLLERAVSLLPESSGPVSLDQLGDALWRVGRREEAVARWREALERAERDAAGLESGDGPSGMVREARERLERIRAKIGAVEGGQEPAVAALGEGVVEAR